MLTHWKPLVVGFVAGLVGVIVALLGWTAWVDHARITAVWGLIEQQQRQQQQPPPPRQPPPPEHP